jgi:hypothetical protein
MTALTASIQPHPQNHIFSQHILAFDGNLENPDFLNAFHLALSLSLHPVCEINKI